MKILLIGGGGFAGFHLKKSLERKNHEVFSADLPTVASTFPGMYSVDMTDISSVETVLKQVRPDRIFLLAAVSSVAVSWKNPDLAVDVNIHGPLNLFHAMEKTVPDARLIFIGSGEEYGNLCSEEHPFTEDMSCSPGNPYAVTKFAAGKLLELLSVKRNFDFVHVRPFNHFGPFQREGFVVADFCAQIARAEAGKSEPLMRVGNLSARRDFLYVDDVIGAYCMMAEAEKCPHSIYNISTGKVWPIQFILDYLISQAKVKIRTEVDPAKFRPVESPALIASNQQIRDDFGWNPETSLEDGLTKTLNWWRMKQG